jgi:hypothetical protein
MTDELIYNREEHGPLRETTAASAYLDKQHGIKRTPARLADLRCSGGGPVFLKQGRRVLYAEKMLDQWAAEINGRPMQRHTLFKSAEEVAA